MIPVCGQSMPMPLKKKKNRNKKTNEETKTTWKSIADRLVLREKVSEMKKSLLPAREKTKQVSFSTPMSMFSGAGLILACIDFQAALWQVQGHNIVSMRVNDFCLLSGFFQGWA